MKNFESYFDEVREFIRIDRPDLLARMREELQDHVEDAEEYLLLESGNRNALERLGPPERVAEAYDTHLRPSLSSLRTAMIVFGIFSIPFSFFFHTAVLNLFDSTTNQSTLIYWIAALFVIDLMALRKMAWMDSDDSKRKNLIRLFLGFQWVLPVLRLMGVITTDLFLEDNLRYSLLTFISLFLAVSTAYLLIRFVIWYFEFDKRLRKEKPESRLLVWRDRIRLIGGAGLLSYVIIAGLWITIRTPAFITDTFPEMSANAESIFLVPWMMFFGLLLMLSFFFNVFSVVTYAGLRFILIPFGIGVQVWMPFLLLSLGITALGIFIGHRIWKDIREERGPVYKRIPWLESSFLIFLLSLFCIGPIGTPHLEWQVPVQDLSEIIEKRELGPFYRFTKNINQDESPLARYEVYARENGFRIDQARGPSFLIPFTSSTDNLSLGKTQTAFNDRIFGWTQTIPAGVTCDDAVLDPQRFITETALQPTCRELAYRGQALFKQKTPRWGFSGMTLSPDGSTAVIRLTGGVYEPEYVFLVDLK